MVRIVPMHVVGCRTSRICETTSKTMQSVLSIARLHGVNLINGEELIESKIEDLHILYVAIEPGCGVYCSNDDEYEGKYYVDAGPQQPDYPFMTEDEVCEFVEKQYQTNVNSIEDCQAFAVGLNKNGDDDEFLYINEMEVYDN